MDKNERYQLTCEKKWHEREIRGFIRQRYEDIIRATGLSEYELSIRIGYSKQTLRQIVIGERKPSVHALFWFCKNVGITLGQFADADIDEIRKIVRDKFK
ncbi:MAG: hypothetical protein LBM01_02875 [Christensenellaceae bacterium]|jgi:transcriptional regulator with XRE-family HTH domain|nr:hypothetical protein [Christensenellaceae bacterium]